jgi:shikimate dehydrogenase
MTLSVLLLGNPVSRSLSPAMQNAGFEAVGIDCRYLVREINETQLRDTIAEMRTDHRILGANVTIPHKQAVIPLLDQLEPLARRIGAVNTISRHDNDLIGANTDVEGFRRAVDECGYEIEGKTVVIIGAGGAARAVAAALQSAAAQIRVAARNAAQADQLCRDLDLEQGRSLALDDWHNIMDGADVVVNATPSDLPPREWLQPGQRVFDVRSRRSPEGRAMLLHQGVASFEIWTGRPAPVEAMRAALDAAAQAVAV